MQVWPFYKVRIGLQEGKMWFKYESVTWNDSVTQKNYVLTLFSQPQLCHITPPWYAGYKAYAAG